MEQTNKHCQKNQFFVNTFIVFKFFKFYGQNFLQKLKIADIQKGSELAPDQPAWYDTKSNENGVESTKKAKS